MADEQPHMVDEQPIEKIAPAENKTNQRDSTPTRRRSDSRELAKELRQRRRRSLSRKRDYSKFKQKENGAKELDSTKAQPYACPDAVAGILAGIDFGMAQLGVQSACENIQRVISPNITAQQAREIGNSKASFDADATSDPWCGWPLMASKKADLSSGSPGNSDCSGPIGWENFRSITGMNARASTDNKDKNGDVMQAKQTSLDNGNVSTDHATARSANNISLQQVEQISTALTEMEREQDCHSIVNEFVTSLMAYSPKAKVAIADLSHSAIRIASAICDQASDSAMEANLPREPHLSVNTREEEKIKGDQQVETVTSIPTITSWTDQQSSAGLFVRFTSCQMVEMWAFDKPCRPDAGEKGEEKLEPVDGNDERNKASAAIIPPPEKHCDRKSIATHASRTEVDENHANNEQEQPWPLVYVAIAITHMFEACETTPAGFSSDEIEASKAKVKGARNFPEVVAFSAPSATINEFERSNEINQESSTPVNQQESEGRNKTDSENPELETTLPKRQTKSSLLEEKLRRWARPKRSSLLPNPHLNDSERLLDIRDIVSSLSELSAFEKAGSQTKALPQEEGREDDCNDNARALEQGSPLRFSC